MPLYNDLDIVLYEIDSLTDNISDVLNKTKIDEKELKALEQSYFKRQIFIDKLNNWKAKDEFSLEDKIRTKEFIDLLVYKDEKNLKKIETRLQGLSVKIKALYNQKNLKVYSKWSMS